MIDALDLALGRLLDDPAAPADVRDCEVSFEPLERSYRPTEPTVNLFLVDVQENLALRDLVPFRQPTANGYLDQPPPLRVDCRYLLTVWTTSTSSPAHRVADEHQLLGNVVSWLARFRALPASTLGPRLADQPAPIRLTVALPHPGREMSELWSALDVSPRPAVWVSAVLALSRGDAEVTGRPVTDIDLSVDEHAAPRTHLHTVGGRVRDAASDRPLSAAQVSIGSLGRHVTSDQAGVFTLGHLPEGTYELEVSAPHYVTATTTVHVPPMADDEYDAALAPQQ